MTAIHKPCSIAKTVKFGNRVTVWAFTSICEGTEIGDDTVIGSNCFIGKSCRIGRGVHMQHGVFLPNGTVVKDHVFLGPGVIATDDKMPRAGNRNYKAQPPLILRGASIGAGAVILPSVTMVMMYTGHSGAVFSVARRRRPSAR